MIRKISTLTAVFAALCVSLCGCSDYLDVNHDPNALEKIPDPKVLLPAAEICVANNLMGWDFGFGGGFWSEYWTQSYSASQFKALCEYQPNGFNNAYQSLTREALTDLTRIKTQTANDENKGYLFVAEALSIFTWQIVTDVWGDMPYSEALRGDEGLVAPKQDKGEEIYADLLKRIDALLDIDLSRSSIDGKYDYVYNGDLDAWHRFAAALKVKLSLRVSETSSYDNAALLRFIEGAELLAASAKIPGTVWNDDMEGKRHPMREFQAGGANYLSQNVIGCKNFVDYLKINADPRLAKLFSGGDRGAFFGDFDSKEDSDGNGTVDASESYCTPAFAGNSDLMLMSEWEVNFNVAEAHARAGQTDKAKARYEAGVKASLKQNGISDFSIVETGYAKWTDGLSTEGNIRQIALQRWVANCNYQHIESFLERNRTKYPPVNEIDIKANRREAFLNFPAGSLTLSVNGRTMLNGNLPASPLYPDGYVFRNPNAPQQKPNVGQKVWWNKKQGK
ncbi:MAG: SusD/RagB family nutrient-binding outer membrane lipoprotein [Prevotellaceae bacterium]|jgi:hypothetical protein|nr:SusD/RagB family nutrient-binding outer membrane lipoprotein [Prevotellaceae bacterium]